MPAAKEAPLKKVPGFSQGVRVTSAARLITMARPICPHSKITVELDSNGRPVPVKSDGVPNCQLNEDWTEWWVECEKLGHDPYFTTHRWYTEEDVIEQELDAEGNPTGRLIKTGERLIPHEDRRINTAQVGAAVNINNGRGPREAMEKKGFKLLRLLGYEEVCQYRNCQKPVVPEGISRRYGQFCSKEHMALIGAVHEEETFDVTDARLAGWDTTKAIKRKERMLREIVSGA